MIQDAVVPRSRLPEVLSDVYRIAAKYHLRIANVFHAGDGNLHPLICFDSRSPAEVEHVKEAGRELMETCVRAGGSISGEHGVGFDKRELLPLIFSEADMTAMLEVRAAFDPHGLMNPGKIIPMPRGCGEGRAAASISSNGNGDATARLKVFQPTAAPGVVLLNQNREAPLREAAKKTGTIAPISVDEVCEVIRSAAADSRSVLAAGGGTWLDAGDPVQPTDLVQTTLLNHIIEHEPADLIASAKPV